MSRDDISDSVASIRSVLGCSSQLSEGAAKRGNRLVLHVRGRNGGILCSVCARLQRRVAERLVA